MNNTNIDQMTPEQVINRYGSVEKAAEKAAELNGVAVLYGIVKLLTFGFVKISQGWTDTQNHQDYLVEPWKVTHIGPAWYIRKEADSE